MNIQHHSLALVMSLFIWAAHPPDPVVSGMTHNIGVNASPGNHSTVSHSMALVPVAYLPVIRSVVAPASLFADAYEPDETCVQAKVIGDGQTQTHTFAPLSGSVDTDYLRFTIPGASSQVLTYSIDIAPVTGNLNGQPFIQMEWPCGTPLGQGGNYGLVFLANGGTTVYFRIYNSLERIGAGTGYTAHLYYDPHGWQSLRLDFPAQQATALQFHADQLLNSVAKPHSLVRQGVPK